MKCSKSTVNSKKAKQYYFNLTVAKKARYLLDRYGKYFDFKQVTVFVWDNAFKKKQRQSRVMLN